MHLLTIMHEILKKTFFTFIYMENFQTFLRSMGQADIKTGAHYLFTYSRWVHLVKSTTNPAIHKIQLNCSVFYILVTMVNVRNNLKF